MDNPVPSIVTKVYYYINFMDQYYGNSSFLKIFELRYTHWRAFNLFQTYTIYAINCRVIKNAIIVCKLIARSLQLRFKTFKIVLKHKIVHTVFAFTYREVAWRTLAIAIILFISQGFYICDVVVHTAIAIEIIFLTCDIRIGPFFYKVFANLWASKTKIQFPLENETQAV